jgi:hypothetical protein
MRKTDMTATLESRIAALEALHPEADTLNQRNIFTMTDKALARAAGAPWLLACTDAELEEIAGGVEECNPARYQTIVNAASKRQARPSF